MNLESENHRAPAPALVLGLAGPFVQSTVIYDRAETEWRRSNAKSAVPDMVGMVKKDELIVDANERVTRDAVLKLRSLRSLEAARRTESEYLYPPLARMLLMLLFIAAFATYLRMELPFVFGDNGMLAGALDTIDTTTADEKGTGATWFVQRYKLNKPRKIQLFNFSSKSWLSSRQILIANPRRTQLTSNWSRRNSRSKKSKRWPRSKLRTSVHSLRTNKAKIASSSTC